MIWSVLKSCGLKTNIYFPTQNMLIEHSLEFLRLGGILVMVYANKLGWQGPSLRRTLTNHPLISVRLRAGSLCIPTGLLSQSSLSMGGGCPAPFTYLLSSWLVWRHVAFQLGPVCKGVTAQGAAEVVFILLMAILNVFFQRGKALVASITIWAGEQLGKCVWCSCDGKRYCNLKHPRNMVSYHQPRPHSGSAAPPASALKRCTVIAVYERESMTINTG